MTRRFGNTVAMSLAMAALMLPLTLLLMSTDRTISDEAPAPCHQEHPDSNAPMGTHHDCCLVGHNHAAQSYAPQLSPAALVIQDQVAAFSLAIPSSPGREPELSSFDPPRANLFLRI